MPFPPLQPTDMFDVGGILGMNPKQTSGFQGAIAPGATALGTRQGRLGSNRAAVNARKMVHWLVPEGPIVQMYVNPQNISYTYKKAITPTRTKGGYAVQYWGEDLGNLHITGTTGTSGVEGINVLYDLYRNEQLAFDPYALYMSSRNDAESFIDSVTDVFSQGPSAGIGGIIGGIMGAAQGESPLPSNIPSLGSMAFTVEMYWSGEVYRGYFTGFTVTESAEALGLFNYDMNFTVTQKRGFRQNFLAWHRSATSGHSGPHVPHSFSMPMDGIAIPRLERNATSQTGIMAAIDDIVDIF